jgi:acetoin utilization protein AcuC
MVMDAASAPFFYHPRMLGYDFGPKHPLKPERLRRTIELLKAEAPYLAMLDPGLATEADILRVHSPEFVGVVKELSEAPDYRSESAFIHGFSKLDTPPFHGMWESSLSYCGGAQRAAEAVRDGSPLAFSMSGGLHHAKRDRANGFCILSDPALAAVTLRERFYRVIYIDIDLHHGDGPQAIFYGDPSVMTFSIHESGASLYPGSGFVEEEGAGLSSINLPMPAKTEGAAWLHAFTQTLDLAIARFKPQAVVFQMGCDPHTLDPLGHLEISVQHWLGAVSAVKEKRLPTVALGGGGYHLPNVPRMWVAAILTLLGRPVPERVPSQLPKEWGMTTYLDEDPGGEAGMEEAERLVDHWRSRLS